VTWGVPVGYELEFTDRLQRKMPGIGAR
jgi:hypothetical protein